MRKPTTPGEILNKEYLEPLGLTQKELASHIKQDIKVINRIVNDKSRITPTLAIKLAGALNTTPQFWLNAQNALDIYKAKKTKKPKSLLIIGENCLDTACLA